MPKETTKAKLVDINDKINALEYNTRHFHTQIDSLNDKSDALLMVTGSMTIILLGIAIYKSITN
jgi:flagellar biosynthesis regulator FlaF